MAGHHVDDAARLIELAAPAMRQSRQEGTLRRWLEALPDEVFADRPVLAHLLGGSADGHGRHRPASSRCSSWWSRRWPARHLRRSSSTSSCSTGSPHKSWCTAPGSPCSPATSTARSRTPPGHSRWSNRPTTSAEAARPRCWRSPTGLPATSNRRCAATPRRSASSSQPITSPTCSDAPSRWPTSRSRRAGSPTPSGPSTPDFAGQRNTPGCAAQRTCTSG